MVITVQFFFTSYYNRLYIIGDDKMMSFARSARIIRLVSGVDFATWGEEEMVSVMMRKPVY